MPRRNESAYSSGVRVFFLPSSLALILSSYSCSAANRSSSLLTCDSGCFSVICSMSCCACCWSLTSNSFWNSAPNMSTCSVGSARMLRGVASPGILRSTPACVVCSLPNCAANVWALPKSPLSKAFCNALRTDPRSASAGVSLSSCLIVVLRLSSAGASFSSCLDNEITRSMSCLAMASCSCFCKSGITRRVCSRSVVTRSRNIACKPSGVCPESSASV